METQAGRNEPDQRRLRVNRNARAISIALKIAFALMAANAQPIIHDLHGQLQIFRGLQLDYYQATLTRDTWQIEHSSVACRERGNLRIKMAGVEQRVEFRGVFQHDGFEPSFRRAAIERVLGVAG